MIPNKKTTAKKQPWFFSYIDYQSLISFRDNKKHSFNECFFSSIGFEHLNTAPLIYLDDTFLTHLIYTFIDQVENN